MAQLPKSNVSRPSPYRLGVRHEGWHDVLSRFVNSISLAGAHFHWPTQPCRIRYQVLVWFPQATATLGSNGAILHSEEREELCDEYLL